MPMQQKASRVKANPMFKHLRQAPKEEENASSYIDTRAMATSVTDLHRVMDVVFSLYLLLEGHNETLLRVALDIVTDRENFKKMLRWDRRCPFSSPGSDLQDDERKNWFRAKVKEKLEILIETRQEMQKIARERARKEKAERLRREELDLEEEERGRAKFELGQRVQRRDEGDEWGFGYVVCLDPLLVTLHDDPTKQREADGCAWDEVRRYEVPASAPATVLTAASFGVMFDADKSGEDFMKDPRWLSLPPEEQVKVLHRRLQLAKANAAAAVAQCEACLCCGFCVNKTTTIGTCTETDWSFKPGQAQEEETRQHIIQLQTSLREKKQQVFNARKDTETARVRIQELEEENEHMKIAMEELQLKLRDFLSKAEDAGGGKVRELVETHEFEAMFSQQTVWERLYEEALERIRKTKEQAEEAQQKGIVEDEILPQGLFKAVAPGIRRMFSQELKFESPPSPPTSPPVTSVRGRPGLKPSKTIESLEPPKVMSSFEMPTSPPQTAMNVMTLGEDANLPSPASPGLFARRNTRKVVQLKIASEPGNSRSPLSPPVGMMSSESMPMLTPGGDGLLKAMAGANTGPASRGAMRRLERSRSMPAHERFTADRLTPLSEDG